MISFAFVPLFEWVSLALAYRRSARNVAFAQAVDAFFAANTPWFVWLLVFSSYRSMQTPEESSGTPLWWQLTFLLSLVPVAAWSCYVDLRLFRAIGTSKSRAAGDLILQKTVSWTCILGWFLGHELWQYISLWRNV